MEVVHASEPSTVTRFLLALRSRLRSSENCSIPNPPHAYTIRASPDCDEYSDVLNELLIIADIEIVVPLR
ncbi:MAG: hypothetical protein CXZ00_10010 [Acidobacteria bacterium]|nr:MAG: hypothetical protein CXZ00_10010 [Acidobacteriota bacterium]